MTKCEKVLEGIRKEWFFEEEVLFGVLCSYDFVLNNTLDYPFRTLGHIIEYSPLIENLPLEDLKEYLRLEVFRILLLHPYKRRPSRCNGTALLLASDITILSMYDFHIETKGSVFLNTMSAFLHSKDHPLGLQYKDTEEAFYLRNFNKNPRTGKVTPVDNLSFETWYHKILFLIENTSLKGEAIASTGIMDCECNLSEGWKEDEEATESIKNQVKNIDEGWSTLGGKAERSIKGDALVNFNYRKVLNQFKNDLLSSKRRLTRMRPNRRFGLDAMGSTYERNANLLVAVDVSGSIQEDSLKAFIHVINNFFCFNIDKLDLIFFDTELKMKPMTIKKKVMLESLKGKGGTDFNIPLNFFKESKVYDGLIIFTDGQGDVPISGPNKKVLWIMDSRNNYDASLMWIRSLGHKSCYLPL